MGQTVTFGTRAGVAGRPARPIGSSGPRRGRPLQPVAAPVAAPARGRGVATHVGRLVYAGSAAAVIALLVAGWSFYTTPLAQRVRHPDYFAFKPGGSVGLSLGMAGAALLVLIPLYSMRKRAKALQGLGALGRWLDVHVYLGIFGPALIVLHAGFKVHGLVAIAFWSMILVTASGFVGRFLYRQIPRSRAGDALSLAALERYDRRLSERLRQDFGVSAALLERIEAMAAPVKERRGISGAVAHMLRGRRERRGELRALALRCHGVPAHMVRHFEALVLEKAVVHRRLALWGALHRLFYYWHTLHKPFAVAMYVFMFIHIGVALITGYGVSLSAR